MRRECRAVTRDNARLAELMVEAEKGRYSRREIVRRGVALGLTAPAIAVALGRFEVSPVAAQDAPVKVSILNKDMTRDEIVTEIQKEGQVNVGNWTYTANDTLIAK